MVSRVSTGEDVDGEGGLAAWFSGAPAGTAGDELGDRSFDHAGVGSESPGGHEVVEDVFADDADEVDGGGFDDVRTLCYRNSASNQARHAKIHMLDRQLPQLTTWLWV